ncbi:MAG: DUF502 domain-containing protein [Opitutaceae bacterium]
MTPTATSEADPLPRSGLATVRDAFMSGALLLAPLVVTVWAFYKIVSLVGGTFRPIFFFYIPQLHPRFDVVLDLVTTLIVLLLVTLLGYVSRDVFGRFFVRIAERFVLSIPGVGAVYISVKQIVDTFGSQTRNKFSKVVLVEFPRKGSWAMGFLTNRSPGEPQRKIGSEVWTVFVPTTPNPTGGYVLFLPPSEIVELDMSIGEGMKMIISGGAFNPPADRHPAAIGDDPAPVPIRIPRAGTVPVALGNPSPGSADFKDECPPGR